MTAIQYPNTDQERSFLLQNMIETETTMRRGGQSYLYDPFLEEITAIAGILESNLEELPQLKYQYSQAVSAKQKALAKLKMVVRHFRKVLLCRMQRHETEDVLLTLYGLSKDVTEVRNGSYQDWLIRAEAIVEGEEDAIAKGYEPMVNPSAAEVREAWEEAESATIRATTTNTALDDKQHKLDALRPDVDRLLRLANAQLSAALYTLPKDDTRNIKRRYGFVYTNEKKEEDEDGG